MLNTKSLFSMGLALICVVLWVSTASAARISDIRNTKHNFSAVVAPNILGGGDTRTVKATSESEICIFCHTPHGANITETNGPLWNRAVPGSATYTPYSSSSIDSTIENPNGVSKLCLSCHDGSIAIGSVRNVRGQFPAPQISMQGTSGGKMPAGAGVNTGYTRNLGKDLSNDHPISLTYNSSFVNADSEMRPVGQSPLFVRGTGSNPGIEAIHLQPVNQGSPTNETGQVQCVSCHDPHIRDTTNDNIKFLRFNRLQKANPDGSNNFQPNNDIICLACHTKDGWETSAHAQSAVANETYTNAAADAREFPRGTAVWETACLACHDTHTVSNSRRLLRAGVDGSTTTLSGYSIKTGTGSAQAAIEETCYACHSPNRGTLNGQGGATFEVPNIYSDFQLARHMPITNNEQPAGTEVHDIGTSNPDTSATGAGADMIESPNNLGRTNLNNRHAECTDCHNPHRVVKRRSFTQTNSGGGMDTEGTHNHVNNHTNIASGVLRGAWGVEPQYSSNSFHVDPSGFTVKRGDPGNNTNTAVTASYVTREYQVCFKCHSNYGFPNGYNGPPTLGVSTPSGRNGMTRYTNVAREYNSPSTHRGEVSRSDGGASYSSNNHRAWHPVMNSTGRDAATRGIANNTLWLTPFRALGSQTMFCSDCHGTDTANGTAVPSGSQPNGSPWGPHGSTNDFILKGRWSGNRSSNTDNSGIPGTGTGAQDHLCFKCHDYSQYADPNNGSPQNSGFALGGGGMMGGMGCMGGGMMCMGMMAGGMNNLHIFHANQVSTFRCNLCHVAVPHGWKNKNFLVNLNDVGQEGGFASPREMRVVADGGTVSCGGGMMGGGGTCAPAYTNGPYYNRAALKVVQFGASSNWNVNGCGSSGSRGNGATGVTWMAGSNEACNNLP